MPRKLYFITNLLTFDYTNIYMLSLFEMIINITLILKFFLLLIEKLRAIQNVLNDQFMI